MTPTWVDDGEQGKAGARPEVVGRALTSLITMSTINQTVIRSRHAALVATSPDANPRARGGAQGPLHASTRPDTDAFLMPRSATTLVSWQFDIT